MSTKLIAEAADGDPFVKRAMAAYWRSAKREGAQYSIPANDSYLAEVDGRSYVVLQNVNGVLAVYRVRNDGFLKELRRWPGELDPEAVAS